MKQYIRPVGIILLVCGLIVLLSGCATLMTARHAICDNREVVREQVERQIEEATEIQDPTKRAAVMSVLALTVAALEKCPKVP